MLAAEAVPRRVVGDERRLVELDRDPEEEREVVLDQRVLVRRAGCRRTRRCSSPPAVLDPSAFTRMSLLRLPPLLVEGRLDHLVVRSDVEALSAASGSSGRARCRSANLLLAPAGGRFATFLPCLRCASRQLAADVERRAARRRHLEVAHDRGHRLRREAGVHQLDAHFDRFSADRRRERPWRRDRAGRGD